METPMHHPAPAGRTLGAGEMTRPAARPHSLPSGLRLVESPGLTLIRPSGCATPEGWNAAIASLGRWLDLELAPIPPRPASGLQRMTGWAAAAASGREGGAQTPPVFAPWQCWSPVSLQQPGKAALPQAGWVSSYLFDGGTGKPRNRGPVDIQLISPLPSACVPGDGEDAPVPGLEVLRAMIRAATGEGRENIVLVTDARRHNALVRQLLLLDRSMTRDRPPIELVSVEAALCRLVNDRSCWDAIIVLPDLRSLIFAMLAQLHAINSPWPLLWHRRGVTMISAEQLEPAAGDLPLDGPLLVQALALAARQAGLGVIARRLVHGMARLWDCGLVTPGRGSVAPYVTGVSDDDFIEQLCRGGAGGQRSLPEWRAIAAGPAPVAGPGPARLRLVRTD